MGFALGVPHLTATLGDAAETSFIQLGCRPDPELITVNEGDTVEFVWGSCFTSGLTESYTGEWTSPVLQRGQTFSHTFTGPGTYVYRMGSPTDQAFYPGVIKVQPVANAYPAIWISRPLDHFTVPGYTEIEAATTNAPQSVKSVNFYADGRFIGSATGPPYVVSVALSTGTYNLTAAVVDIQAQTNTSSPVQITFTSNFPPQLFQSWRLPQGQTVLYQSGPSPWCLQWSGDLKVWNQRIRGQLTGDSVLVDETTTNNVPQRFYFVRFCL